MRERPGFAPMPLTSFTLTKGSRDRHHSPWQTAVSKILWKWRKLLRKCLTHFLAGASGTARSPGAGEGYPPSPCCHQPLALMTLAESHPLTANGTVPRTPRVCCFLYVLWVSGGDSAVPGMLPCPQPQHRVGSQWVGGDSCLSRGNPPSHALFPGWLVGRDLGPLTQCLCGLVPHVTACTLRSSQAFVIAIMEISSLLMGLWEREPIGYELWEKGTKGPTKLPGAHACVWGWSTGARGEDIPGLPREDGVPVVMLSRRPGGGWRLLILCRS